MRSGQSAPHAGICCKIYVGMRLAEPRVCNRASVAKWPGIDRARGMLCGVFSFLLSVSASGAAPSATSIPRPDREFLTVLQPSAFGASGTVRLQTGRSVRLRSGTFRPVGTISENLLRLRAAAPSRPVRALVELAQPPTTRQRTEAELGGLRLGRVLTDGLWFALVEPGADVLDLRRFGVSWLGGYYSEDKISPQVASEGWGAWAIEAGGRVALQARFFEDVSEEVLRELLAGVGAEVRRVDVGLQKVELAIDIDQAIRLLELDAIRWLEEVPPPRVPLNNASRQLVGADVLQEAPYGLTGSGVVLGICDSGTVDSHPDFAGRLELLVTSAPTDHTTHVAGTMAGDGAASEAAGGTPLQWRGVAPGADIVSWRFNDPVNPHAGLVQRGGVLSQNSWGLLISPDTFSCHLHGTYQYYAPEYDAIVRGFFDGTPLNVVFAAGNLRWGSDTNSCGYGPYGVISPPGTAKNVITVGAVDSVTDAMAFFSSWGPAADGRLKPDVVAPGWQASDDLAVTSTSSTNVGGYSRKQGTSMAAPVVSGGIALLVEDYRNLFGGADPLPSTMKAVLIHTAKDLDEGSNTYYNPGPDFASGYGRVQLPEAVGQVRANAFWEDQVAHGDSVAYYISVGEGTSDVKFTLVWDDAAGVEAAAVVLVNDLDLVVVDAEGTRHYPWTLDPLDPSAPARQDAEDHLNVVEQIEVRGPVVPGLWQVQVVGSTVAVGATQTYSLATSPIVVLEGIYASEDSGAGSNGNGSVDPGEEVLVESAVRNLYADSAGPSSTVIASAAPELTVLESASSFAPLVVGELGTNDPPFRVRVSRDAACGIPLQLVQTTTLEGVAFSNVLELIPGAYGVTNTATNFVESVDPQLPLTIPDGIGSGSPGATATSVNTVPFPGQLTDLAVMVRIDHSWEGDLGRELEHPDGTRVVLRPLTGDSGVNFGTGSCGVDVVWTVFEDGAADSITNASAPFAASYLPVEPLAALLGKAAGGEWKLHLNDYFGSDQGELLCWGLRIGFEELGYVCETFNRGPVALAQSVNVIYGFSTPLALQGKDDDDDTLTFALADLPTHGTVTDFDSDQGTLTYVPDPAYAGPDSLTFTVSDGLAESAAATVSITVMDPAADVALAWVSGSVVAGQEQPFVSELTLTNRGPNDVTSLTVQVDYPAEVVLLSSEPQPGTATENSTGLLWNLGNLAAGGEGTLTLSLQALAPAVWTNLATVSFGEDELDPADNTAPSILDIRPVIDLEVGFMPQSASWLLEQASVTEVRVTNLGTNAANDVVVTGLLPPELALLSTEVSEGISAGSGPSIQWQVEELLPGAQAWWRWTLNPIEVGIWTQQVAVIAYEVDTVSSNDTAETEVDVVPAADLIVTAAMPSQSLLGEALMLDVWVTNAGPSETTAVVVRATNESQLSFTNGLPSEGVWTPDGSGWNWTIPTLSIGTEVHLQVEGYGALLGSGTNWLEVSSGIADPDLGNNTLESSLEILPASDLQVTATGPVIVIQGDAAPFIIALTNLGPSDATLTTLELTLQTGLEVVVPDPDPGIWTNPSPGLWRWEIGDMVAGGGTEETLMITGLTLGSWTNVLSAQALEADPRPETSTVSFVVDVRSDADVQLLVNTAPDPVFLGTSVTQRVDVVNGGPNVATYVQGLTEVSQGWNLLSVEVSEGLWSENTGVVDWQLGPLASGGQAWMEIALEPLLIGRWTNLMSVSAAEQDFDLTNNAAEFVGEIVPAADLGLSVISTARVLQGDTTTQAVVLTNAGPLVASSVQVETLIPAGLTLLTSAASTGSVSAVSGLVSWDVGAVEVGAQADLQLEFSADGLGLWTNTYSATALEADPILEDNTLEVVTAVRLETDLAVSKTTLSSPVLRGQRFAYDLVVTNQGPNTAAGVVVEDRLPAGVSFSGVTITNGQWSIEGGLLRWELSGLAPEEEAALNLQVSAEVVGTWTNRATVAAEEIDFVVTNDLAEAEVEIVPAADLGVMLGGPTNLLLGQAGWLQIDLTNAGPSEATMVSVTGILAPEVEWLGGLVSTGEVADLGSGQWSWTITNLAAGEFARLDLNVSGINVGLGTNTVVVSGSELDPVSSDNTAEFVGEIVPAADLGLSVISTARVLQGDTTTQAVVLTNAGPLVASSVQVETLIPAGLTLLTSAASTGSVSAVSGLVSWDVGAVEVGAQADLQLEFSADGLGLWTNTYSATALEADPILEDNTLEVVTAVRLETDLAVSKTTLSSPVLRGQRFAYDLVVTNQGPNTAAGVVVEDRLPAGVSFSGVTITNGQWSIEGGLLRWELSGLAPEEEAALNLQVSAEVVGTWTNRATVAAEEIDFVVTNDLAEAEVEIVPAADLGVMLGGPTNLLLGQAGWLQIDLTNAGPSEATMVSVTGILAPEVEWLGGLVSTGEVADLGSGQWSWTITNLAAGEFARLDLNVSGINVGLGTNTVVVSGSELDPVSSDNAAEFVGEIVPAADLGLEGVGTGRALFGVDPIVHTWSLTNRGPSEATAVAVNGRLDTLLVATNSVASQGVWTSTGEDWEWDIGILPAGAGASLTLELEGLGVGVTTNEATATALEADPILPDNTASISTVLRLETDLGVIQSSAAASVLLGGEAVFHVGLTNHGPNLARGLVVTDLLPAGLVFVDAEASVGDWAFSGGTVTWQVDELPVGDTAALSLTNQALATGWITNTVSVSAEEIDFVPGNDVAEAAVEVLPAADLGVVAQGSFVVALTETATHTLTITNVGPSAASQVMVTGWTAAGLEVTGVVLDVGSWTNDLVQGYWRWTIDGLHVDESAHLGVTLLGLSEGVWTNLVEVTALEADPASANNTLEAAFQVRSDADVGAYVLPATGPVLRGQPYQDEIRATNAGPATATGIVVETTLDEGVSLNALAGSEGNLQEEGQRIIWTLPTLAPGTEAWLQLLSTPPFDGMFTNKVVVTSAQPDLELTNNAAEWVVQVLPAVDLVVGIQGASMSLAGASNELEVVVTNLGPSDATGALVRGLLDEPSGNWSGVVGTPDTGAWLQDGAGSWTWAIDTLSAGEGSALQLRFDGYADGDWTNRVDVTSAENDSDLSNNVSQWVTRARDPVDVALDVVTIPDTLLQQAEFSLQLTLTNHGPYLARANVVQGTLPEGVQLADVVGDGGTWVEEPLGFRWEWGDLDVGNSPTITATFRADVSGAWTNQVEVTADAVDLVSSNNTVSWFVTVLPAADVALTAPGGGVHPLQGSWVEMLTLTNAGPSAATDVRLDGFIPVGLQLEATTGSVGVVTNFGDGRWSWDVGTLGVAGAAEIELTWAGQELGLWTNQVAVTFTEEDPVSTDTQAEWVSEIVPAANLAVSGGIDGLLLLGEQEVQEITVTNAGPSDATGVQVQGSVLEGVEFSLELITAGVWTPGAAGWTWDIGNLPADGEVVLQLRAQGMATGDWTNRVDVAGAQVDLVPADNSSTWINAVKPASDLSVSAMTLQSLVLLGRPTMIDLVVTNVGPDTAEEVLVTNRFSGGVLLGVVDAGWEVTTNMPSEVVWSVDSLAPGEAVTLQITLLPTGLEGITNQLEVTGNVVDAIPDNNAFLLPVVVNPLAKVRLLQSVNQDPVMVGDVLHYLITVISENAYDLGLVLLRDTLPEGAEFVQAVASQGTVLLQGDTVVADFGTLGAGQTATLALTIRPHQLGISTNLTLLEAAEADPADPDLHSALTVTVVETPPLTVAWTGSAVMVSWPAIASDYQLQRANSLAQPNWEPDLNTPRLSSNGERLEIFFRSALSERYYRLVKPTTP